MYMGGGTPICILFVVLFVFKKGGGGGDPPPPHGAAISFVLNRRLGARYLMMGSWSGTAIVITFFLLALAGV